MSNYYKIFFTISFEYAKKENKVVSKYFKSDVDLGPLDFSENVDDKNIVKLWKKRWLIK